MASELGLAGAGLGFDAIQLGRGNVEHALPGAEVADFALLGTERQPVNWEGLVNRQLLGFGAAVVAPERLENHGLILVANQRNTC